MHLLFPVNSDMVTLVFAEYRAIKTVLLQRTSLNYLQYRILSYLRWLGSACSRGHLADVLNVSSSSVSLSLSKMYCNGFISKEKSFANAHCEAIAITPLGLKELAHADCYISKRTIAPLLERLTVKEIDVLLDSLVKNDAFTEYRKSGQTCLTSLYVEKSYQSYHALNEIIKKRSVIVNDFRILFNLYESENFQNRQSVMLKKLFLKRNEMSNSLSRLEEMSFVRKETDTANHKRNCLTLCNAGLQHVQSILPDVDGYFYQGSLEGTEKQTLCFRKIADVYQELYA